MMSPPNPRVQRTTLHIEALPIAEIHGSRIRHDA